MSQRKPELVSYSPDAAINDPTQDLLHRWPFSQRIAQIIANRNDPSSIVIGIYGAWGEGKTSVLNLVAHELKQHNVIVLKFNPWRFSEEEQLLRNFFADLMISIDQSIQTGREKIGEFIQKYSGIFSVFDKAEAAQGVVSLLNSANLQDLRERVEKALEENKKQVVILIDDLDRLDKEEIFAVTRLVKLTADFKYITYILAFDKHIVASALQERYGSRDDMAGESFLEKIIQIPLRLPPADPLTLWQFCFKGIEKALHEAEITLKFEQQRNFVRLFTGAFEEQLKTPRKAKLYINILSFTLPLLKDEVNPVDFMLIEALSVFYHNLYNTIKRHPETFLQSINSYLIDDEKERHRNVIESALEEIDNVSRKGVRSLLVYLFPKIQTLYRNIHFSNDEGFSEEQRVASPDYFPRYFSHAIHETDLADSKISQLLQRAENSSVDEIRDAIVMLVDGGNKVHHFINKISNRVSDITEKTLHNLVIAIAKSGEVFPEERGVWLLSTTADRAALLIFNLIQNVRLPEARIEIASRVIQEAEPLLFAWQCLKWYQVKDDNSQADLIAFTNSEKDIFGASLAKRVSNLSNEVDLLSEYGDEGVRLLEI